MADTWQPDGKTEATISPPPTLSQLGKMTQVDYGPLEPKEAALVKLGVAQQGAPIAAKPARMRSDELMARANEIDDLKPEEREWVRTAEDSRKLVAAHIGQDPNGFGKQVMLRLQEKKGDARWEALIDEADQIEIEDRKKNNPLWRDGGSAAAFINGFLNEATFGQLTGIYALAGATKDGVSYEDAMRAAAKEVRLFEKAHPGITIAGNIAAYMVPGSPAKAAFTALSKGGAKLAAAVIPRAVKSAAFAAKTMQAAGANAPIARRAAQVGVNAIESAAGSGAAAMGIGAIKGTLGEDFESLDLSRGGAEGINDGLTGFLIGGAIPVGGALASETLNAFKPLATKGIRAIDKGVGRVMESVSGAPQKALRGYNKNPGLVRGAAGSEFSVTEDLLDFVTDESKSKVQEIVAANKMLPTLPDVDISGVIKFLKRTNKTINPDSDPVAAKLGEWAGRMEARMSPGATKVPATLAREFVRDMQKVVRDKNAYGRESAEYLTNLKVAARGIRRNIIRTAEAEGGEAGKIYGQLMEKGAEKVRLVEYISKKLGRTEQAQAENGRKFYDQMFGRNGRFIEARLRDLDAKFGDVIEQQNGTGFYRRYQLAKQAEQLQGGAPGWIPQQTTGAFSKGPQIAGGLAGGVGALAGGFVGNSVAGAGGAAAGAYIGGKAGKAIGTTAGTIASSPKVARIVIGASENISKAVRLMFADPEALRRVANGKVGARIPLEVRRMAYEIEHALTNDGATSAAGVVRLVADTPYYVGLLHSFDLAQQRREKNTSQSAMAKLKAQQLQTQIARPTE